MINKWKIIYYENKNLESEILNFIEKLKTNEQAKLFSWLSLLEERGPELPRPYSDILIDGIHELRIKLKGNQVRILYFFCFKDYIILTHAFIKHTDKVPKNEIEKAKRIRADFLQRYNEKSIKEEFDEDTK